MIPLANFRRYFETLRHLKAIQFTNRVTRKLRRPRNYVGPTPKIRDLIGSWVPPIGKNQSLVGPRTFRFLNETGSVDSIGWGGKGKSALWHYNLHYFDDWSASDAQERSSWHLELERDWIQENPPGSAVSWDAYPTSLRLVNLAKTVLSGRPILPAMAQSIAVQALWLERQLEYHLLGNHLYANAKALMFAGAILDGSLGDRLWEQGARLALAQTREQMLDDGGHFELSPMYHSIILEDMLDLLNLMGARCALTSVDCALRNELRRAASIGLEWLRTMSHPDGEISFFNDAAFGISASPQALGEYAGRLAIEQTAGAHSCKLLPNSGFARLQVGNSIVIADVGEVGAPYQPGHAHADTLSFEWSLAGHRFIVNGGTSEYGVSPERSRQRSTAAHSTLELEGQNSSDTWAGFRVGRRARPKLYRWKCDAAEAVLEASHDGYRMLSGRPVHIRKWKLDEESLEIEDSWSPGVAQALIRFHLPPSVTPQLRQGGALLTHSANPELRVEVSSSLPIAIVASTWHPGFGKIEASHSLVMEAKDASSFHSLVRFTW